MALENTQAQYFIRKSYKKVWNEKLRSLVRAKKKNKKKQPSISYASCSHLELNTSV